MYLHICKKQFYLIQQNRLEGNVEFKKATFRYPTRPQVRVLRDLDLSLTSGQRIALVGPSGCGKSTCIQLLQRFYDLKSGELVSIFSPSLKTGQKSCQQCPPTSFFI